MIKNNIEKDIKIKCVEADTTQAALADKIGKTVQYVNRIVKKDDGVVNKTFIQMMEGLGYHPKRTISSGAGRNETQKPFIQRQRRKEKDI